jgi:hypothetical protein
MQKRTAGNNCPLLKIEYIILIVNYLLFHFIGKIDGIEFLAG